MFMPEILPTAQTSLRCAIHGRFSHYPKPLYCELHHIVPQAWQLFRARTNTGRPIPPYTGDELVARGPGLWDARVVPVCATGHRNIHRMLVLAMRSYETQPSFHDHPSVWIADAWRETKQPTWVRREIACARLAMERYEAAGGNLLDLCNAGLYGEA